MSKMQRDQCNNTAMVRPYLGIDTASMLKYWQANIRIISILCLSRLCARSSFGILPAPDHFSSHSSGTSDEERDYLKQIM